MEKQKKTIKKLSLTKLKISKLDLKHVFGGHQSGNPKNSHCRPGQGNGNGNDGQNG
ncbi:hypothetical protein ABW636_06150 [Aquimarina sp. 2201CG1-2-11]|uniref:hypothetical protein n=1 Tax=Aquimarina discodermiae TaxID=3231043 RepID=UPI003461A4A8